MTTANSSASSSPRQTRELQLQRHGQAGPACVHHAQPDLDIRIPYATDAGGKVLPLMPGRTGQYPQQVPPDNRIAEDAHYLYRYDRITAD